MRDAFQRDFSARGTGTRTQFDLIINTVNVSLDWQPYFEALTYGGNFHTVGAVLTPLVQKFYSDMPQPANTNYPNAAGGCDMVHQQWFKDRDTTTQQRPGGLDINAVLTPLSVPAFTLIAGDRSISGSATGTPYELRKLMRFAARSKVAPTTELFPMSKINDAIKHVRDGKARYRVVLKAISP